MACKGMPFDDAADLVSRARPIVRPNYGFLQQLKLYEDMKFSTEGTSPSHKQYKILRAVSLLADHRDKWKSILPSTSTLTFLATPTYIQAPYLGDQLAAESSATDPLTVYICKECQCHLFPPEGIIPHEPRPTVTGETPTCNLFFVLPYNFMGAITQEQGQLTCPTCQAQLGQWNWEGLPCSCGLINKPACIYHQQ